MQKLPSLLALSLVAALCVACGKKEETPYTGAVNQPLVPIDSGSDDTGDNQRNTPPRRQPTNPTPAPTPAPQPGPGHGDHGGGVVSPTPAPAPNPAPAPAPEPEPDHTTKYCKKDANGDYPETVSLEKGVMPDFVVGRGGGCIRRPIRDVWGASLNQPLMVWNDVSESRYQQFPAPAGTTHFFNVTYIVHNFITVDWQMDWYHSVQLGTPQAPRKILINYQRVRGTSHIPYWQGSIILDRVNDDVTSFTMVNQIRADRTDENDAMNTVGDVFGKLRTGAPDVTKLP